MEGRDHFCLVPCCIDSILEEVAFVLNFKYASAKLQKGPEEQDLHFFSVTHQSPPRDTEGYLYLRLLILLFWAAFSNLSNDSSSVVN